MGIKWLLLYRLRSMQHFAVLQLKGAVKEKWKGIYDSGTQEKIRKIVSPPTDIFLSGIPNWITKQYIVDDLNETNIKITADDVVLMSRPSETFNIVSYRVRVAAADLQKSLSPAGWPLRVHVWEFNHYPEAIFWLKCSCKWRGNECIWWFNSNWITHLQLLVSYRACMLIR